MLPEDEPPETLWKKEDIVMQLDKIPELEKRMNRLENEMIILKKRIKKLQKAKK